jgi:hypothetical protein
VSKRIRDLIQMAYHTGYLAAKLEHGAVPDSERAEVDDAQRQIIDARNAARDALEADVQALQNAALVSLAWLTTLIGHTDANGHAELTLDLPGLRESAKWLNDAIVKMRE